MEEQLLKKRITELRKRAEYTYGTEFTDFLTLSEIDTVKSVLHGANYMFYGGMENTERCMLCIAHEDIEIMPEMFPIRSVLVQPKNMKFAECFGHRDVLGSVLGLGLAREVIGDIFIREKEALVLCTEQIAVFLTEHLVQVRHTNVVCTISESSEQDFQKEYQYISRTVSAVRIDTIAAAAFGISRSSATSAVSAGKVFINGREITTPSTSVKEDDVISFRGLGKAKLKEIGGLTKKGRITVSLERYR
ncbi:MAG: hypothetical protein IJZ55_06950 [Lachnospiraceae bacterium]|nr:hypothetical protein [Lachnospiraceae bacterium]